MTATGDSAGLPMICDRCGLHFPFTSMIAVGSGGSIRAQFSGNMVDCPRCNGRARQEVGGEYEIRSDGTWRLLRRIIADAAPTAEEAQRLRDALVAAQQRNASPEEIAQEIAAQGSKFAPLAEAALGQKSATIATWLAFLLSILLLLREVSPQGPAPSPQPAPIVIVNNYPMLSGETQKIIERAIREADACHAKQSDPPPKGKNEK